MSLETFKALTCDFCGLTTKYQGYKFPEGYKYFYNGSRISHSCGSCCKTVLEANLALADKKDLSQIIVKSVDVPAISQLIKPFVPLETKHKGLVESIKNYFSYTSYEGAALRASGLKKKILDFLV